MATNRKATAELPLLMLVSTIVAIAVIAVFFRGSITGAPISCTDQDSDTFSPDGGTCGQVDCDDSDASINPNATEVACDSIDQDCSGSDFSGTDVDSDNYKIEGGACGAVDCNDADSAVNPGATEVCANSIDDNCNGQIDENCNANVTCTDNDHDGFATEGGACGPVDCNDGNPTINPGETDLACDGIDQDCSGSDVTGTDADNDTYKIEDGLCGSIDCNDANSTIHPGATDLACDGIDQDCSGLDFPGTDADNDTYKIDGGACSAIDCNDNSVAVHPGATDVACNGIDEDCSGAAFNGTDTDGDGYKTEGGACGVVDCSDSNANVHPGAVEICDGLDNDCNGQIDDSDLDGDGVDLCSDNCPGTSNSGQQDSDSDGVGNACDPLKGKASSIASNVDLKVYVGDETNLSKSFDGLKTVQFKTTNNKLLAQFNFNFSNGTLDLTNVSVKINELTGRGSIAISGLPLLNKTIYVDKISGSKELCVKDAEVTNISELDGTCTTSVGVKIGCPGENGTLECDLVGTSYKISGLTHSAALELPANQTNITATNVTNKTIPVFIPPVPPPVQNVTETASVPGAGSSVVQTPASKTIKASQIVALIAAIAAAIMFVVTRLQQTPKKPQRPQQRYQYPRQQYNPYYNYYQQYQQQYRYPPQQYPQNNPQNYPQQYPQQPPQQYPQNYPQNYPQQYPQQYSQQNYPQNNGQYYWPPRY